MKRRPPRKRHPTLYSNTIKGRRSPGGGMVALDVQRIDADGHLVLPVLCHHCGKSRHVSPGVFYQGTRQGRHDSCGCLSSRGKAVERIRDLLKRGLGLTAIARELGQAVGTVRATMRRNGLVPPPRGPRSRTGSQPSSELRAEAVAYANETSAHKAAIRFGVSERTIVRWRTGYARTARTLPPRSGAGEG